MTEPFAHTPVPAGEWSLTAQSFHRLLEWLGTGTADGQTYLDIRRRLVAYFDRKNCRAPNDLADDVLNRVARRLEEAASIDVDPPAKYCFIVARFVFMEHRRESQKADALRDDLARQEAVAARAQTEHEESQGLREKQLECLERCASKLEPRNREMIVRYYTGRQRSKIENRRALAAQLGITPNALSIRAFRVREALEECVRQCMSEA
jgi:DNA-directed RNA polymerase specialized sigma24 family protein